MQTKGNNCEGTRSDTGADACLTRSSVNTLRSLQPVFWLKCINLSKCTQFCSTHKLELANKFFILLTKNYLMGWHIRGLKDSIFYQAIFWLYTRVSELTFCLCQWVQTCHIATGWPTEVSAVGNKVNLGLKSS